MNNDSNKVGFSIPPWVSRLALKYKPTDDVTERMRFVIEASRQNILQRTGGPFAAAVFESQSGKLIALGVNLVTKENLSLLHAETVALTLAQSKLQTYDLSRSGLPMYELVTSSQPCIMCYGATLWSGVRRVVIGARRSDVCAVGFDEGPLINAWQEELHNRGIETICDVERDNAKQVLIDYARQGGTIYNSRVSVLTA